MTASLSAWWAQEAHRGLAGTTDQTKRLAIALGPVRSAIRVIDDHVPPMTVDWAQVNEEGKSVSGTDFENGRVIINPLPVIENNIPIGDQIDIVTGFALHEASHGKHSRSAWEHLTKDGKPAFEPMQIAAWLWNVAEDVRVEAATMSEWRGTRPYFDRVRSWVWKETLIHEAAAFDRRTRLQKQLSLVFVACRFPEHANTEDPETAWWQAWQDDYLTGEADVPTTIQRGLDRLAATSPEIDKEMRKLSDKEREAREAGEALRDQLQRLMKEIGHLPGGCITREGEMRELSSTEADAVEELVAQGLVEEVAILSSGDKTPTIWVRKPTEDRASQRNYIGRPDAGAEALRSAIVFRPEAPMSEQKLQREGELDEEELWRWPADNRLFSQRIIESHPDTVMGLLVDMSGSMAGGSGGSDDYESKLAVAQRLAQLFVYAMHDEQGVETRVWGHTGDLGRNTAEVYRLWEPGDPLSRLGLIGSMQHANNYDGHAIGYCVEQMRHYEQPQKVLFVLSDGLPQGSGYGGLAAINHVRSITDWARKQEVEVIQIAIDADLRVKDQDAMFGTSWVPYRNNRQLVRDLGRLMLRFAR